MTTLSESPILDERFTLGYSWQGRRTGFGVSAFQSDQTKEDLSEGTVLTDFNETQYRGVSATPIAASRATFLISGLNWSEDEPEVRLTPTTSSAALNNGESIWA